MVVSVMYQVIWCKISIFVLENFLPYTKMVWSILRSGDGEFDTYIGMFVFQTTFIIVVITC